MCAPLQAFFEANPEYFFAVEGQAPAGNAAHEEIHGELPAGWPFTKKWLIGFANGTGAMVAWWGDVGSNVKTNDQSVIGDVCGFDILPGSDDVYNSKTGAWEKLASGPNYAPNMAYIGWGVYVMARVDSDQAKHKAAWSAAAPPCPISSRSRRRSPQAASSRPRLIISAGSTVSSTMPASCAT